MPAFKLTPTEDEHLYSLISAYLAVLGSNERRALLRQAFGRTTGRLHIMFPNRIRHFAETDFAPFDDAGRIVEEMTPLPYFQRFVADDVRQGLLDGMLDEGGTEGGATFPVRLVQAPGPRHVRFCPRCAEESLATRTVAPWRRVHQMPGVVVCPDHEVALSASGIRTDRMRKLAPGPSSACGFQPIQTGIPAPMAYSLARNTAWLLRNPGPSLSAPALGSTVARMLSDAGWPPGSRGVQARTRDAFERMLDEVNDDDDRRELGLTGRPGHKQNWIARLWEARSETVLHPIRYLLFLAFVQRDVRDLVGIAETVARQPFPEIDVRHTVPREATLARNKARFAAFVADNPRASRTELRLLDPSLHVYLSRTDPEWLKTAMPSDRRALGLKQDRGNKDAETADKVAQAVARLLAAPGRPEPTTLTSIAKSARINVSLISGNERYPLASTAAAAAVDDVVSYRRRRLEWGLDQLLRERARPSWRTLRRQAGVPHDWLQSDLEYTASLMRRWEKSYANDVNSRADVDDADASDF